MIESLKNKIQEYINASFNHSLHHYFLSRKPLTIIQIGANDGEQLDPVRPLLTDFKCRALLVEPQPLIFLKLANKYLNDENIECKQLAITPEDGNGFLSFYTLQPKEGELYKDAYSLWGSFDETHLEKFRKAAPNLDKLKTEIRVPTLGINELIAQSGFDRIDYLQIDVEGWDEKLVNAIDFQTLQPALIRFEHVHANRAMVFQLLEKVKQFGYSAYSVGMDTILVHSSISSFFKKLASIKQVHKNWLLPPKPQVND